MTIVCVAAALAVSYAHGLAKKTAQPGQSAKATPPEAALRAYVERVRAQQAAEVRTPGSIETTRPCLSAFITSCSTGVRKYHRPAS